MGEKNSDTFDIMKSIGNGITNAVFFLVWILVYWSRRDFFSVLLSNDAYWLGFFEGVGLCFLMFGKFSKHFKTIINIVRKIIKQSQD